MQALALALVAGLGTGDASFAADPAWSGLDAEIQRLAASVGEGGGPMLSGFLQTSFETSSDPVFSRTPGSDLLGFDLDYARIEVRGSVGNNRVEIGFDGAGGDVELVDAFVTMPITGTLEATMGHFRSPLLHSSLEYKPNTLFPMRSALGEMFAARDTGAMLHSASGPFGWFLAVQNGVDDRSEDLKASARVEYHFAGNAYRVDDSFQPRAEDLNMSVAVSFLNDQGDEDDETVAGDLAYAQGPLLFTLELVQFTELDSEPSPFGGELGWLMSDGNWQFVAGFQDADDGMNTQTVSIGFNHVVHDAAKWQVALHDVQSDDDLLEGRLFEVALVVVY